MNRKTLIGLSILILLSFGLQGDRQESSPHFIQVLNHRSRPVVGEEWTVQFITNGRGELVIENFNPDEVEFVGLECESVVVVGGKGIIESRKVKGLRQEGSRTTVDWHYGMGKAILRPLKPGGHKVEFAFGGSKDAAFNQATEVVSTESTDDSYEPAIAVDSTSVYIAWEDDTDYGGSGTDQDIFFKSKPIGGSWPAATEVVSTESTDNSLCPAIAVDSTNVYITWHDFTDYDGSGADRDIFFKSKPIGGSWPAATEVVSTESTISSYWSHIAVDSTNVYITWHDWTNLGGDGADRDIFFKSKPIGGSWPAATEVVSSESTDSSYSPAIAVDSTTVYITWDDSTNYGGSGTDWDIFFKSKPIGGGWPATTEVVSTESTTISYEPAIAVDSTTVYITWDDMTDYGGAGGDWDIFFKSKPIGGSWPAATEVVSTESTTISYNPIITVDSTSVYIAWEDDTDYGGSGGDCDIFFKSKPIGGSWPAATAVISTESTDNSREPAVAVDSTNVYVAWEDYTDYDGAGTDGDVFFKSKPIIDYSPTITTTATVSASITPTPTISATPTESATPSASATVTPTSTPSVTLTDSATFTVTPSRTKTSSPSPTYSATPTATPTRTWSLTSTGSPTPSVTSTISPTGTIALSATITPTVTHTPKPPEKEALFISRNIFNPDAGETVEIRWSALGPGKVSLVIYNTAGELVKRLRHGGIQAAGVSETTAWDGRNEKSDLVASGVYIVYLRGRRSFVAKVAVVK